MENRQYEVYSPNRWKNLGLNLSGDCWYSNFPRGTLLALVAFYSATKNRWYWTKIIFF
jgi:hypothetical protein